MAQKLLTSFIIKRMLVAYLTLGVSAALDAYFFHNYITTIVLLPVVLGGSFVMYWFYKKDMATEQNRFIEELNEYVSEFRYQIAASNNEKSLLRFALDVTQKDAVRKHTIAWDILVSKYVNDLERNVAIYAIRLEKPMQNSFATLLKEFENYLRDFTTFRDNIFFPMITRNKDRISELRDALAVSKLLFKGEDWAAQLIPHVFFKSGHSYSDI